MARVWLYQHAREKEKGRTGKWSVGWYEGRSKRSKTVGTKTEARLYASNLESRLNSDQFSGLGRVTWEEYMDEYRSDAMPRKRLTTSTQFEIAVKHIDRILKPRTLNDFTRQTISKYVSTRLAEKHNGKPIAAPTVNKELRQLRAMLNEAAKRKYIASCPPIDLVRTDEKIPTYCPPEHFVKLYGACDVATKPTEQGFSAPDWWRAYLIFLYCTGWRRDEPLSLRRESIDWENAVVYLDPENTKGRRGEVVHLQPIVMEHLERLKSFGPMLFPWKWSRRQLHEVFWEIQDEAGVKRRDGRRYGFHDLRRSFATMNADRVSAEALQRIMRHKSYTTTQKYINAARLMRPASESLYVPELPKREGGAG